MSDRSAILWRIRQCQNQMWLGAIINRVCWALWGSLAISAALVIARQFGVTLHPGWVAALVGSPLPLAALSAMARCRPSLSKAACFLDRLEAKPGLHDAALYVLTSDRGQLSGGDTVAVKRAATHAAKHEHAPVPLWPDRPALALIPLSLCFGFVFWGTLPNTSTAVLTETLPTAVPAPTDKESSLRDIQATLSQLVAAPENTGTQRSLDRQDASTQAIPGSQMDTASPEVKGVPAVNNFQPMGVDGQPGSGNEAGLGRGARNEDATAVSSDIPIRAVDIERIGQRLGGQGQSTVPSTVIRPSAGSRIAAHPTIVEATANMSPAERRLAAAYEERLGAPQ